MSLNNYAYHSWDFEDDYVFGGKKRRKAKRLAAKARRQKNKKRTKEELKHCYLLGLEELR